MLPMAFVRGLMGPYMRPIPIGASVAMLFSLVVAFVVSPWLAYRLFRRQAEKMAEGAGRRPTPRPRARRASLGLYARLFRPLLASAWRRWALLGAVAVLLAAVGRAASRCGW